MATKFQKGCSGNAAGRPKGIKDKRLQWREALAEHLPELVDLLVAKAKAGDEFSIRLVLERVAPPLRPQGPTVELPDLLEAPTLSSKAEAILGAVASGRLPVDTGRGLLDALAAVAKAIEVEQLTARIEALENAVK